MNKIQRTACKVFTPEFLILMQSIPQQYIDDKNISELIKNMGKHLGKKKISDCLIALSFYITSITSEYEKELDKSFNQIREYEAEDKTKQYIQ